MQTADKLTAEERQAVGGVLATEYAGLMAALNGAWSASLLRTSIYLISLSAAGVALDFGVGALRPAPRVRFRTARRSPRAEWDRAAGWRPSTQPASAASK